MPQPKDLQFPPDKIRQGAMSIEGDWLGRTGMDSASMTITRQPNGEYKVDFSTAGCLGRWRLKRTAHYKNGVLTMDRPVQEYCPITFKALFAIRIDGKDLLLPASNVADLLKDINGDGTSKLGTIGVHFYTYGRYRERYAETRSGLKSFE